MPRDLSGIGESNLKPLINSVQHNKDHLCWCHGSLRRQVISNDDIDYVESVSSRLT